ncbi:P-loop containing nucleoside triphosphate hydrolase protein [Podospora australis]|uniref:P-loop containing nucleoside triphosphate hydrolase protein n=1 Tax=Podospora australis TaxID=1536484 RepID=A0AAN6WY06_9PEZI|nr:P-loop containing nucleoside triphosphate hydrolase protein [Podospora australis]
MASYQHRNSHYASHERHDSSASRRPTSERRDTRGTRSSDGTVSTMMSTTSSTGRESAATAMTEGPAYSKKIVVVGDGGCGKTCLLISYSQGYFPEKYVPTVFENYITYPTHPPTGKTVELALWDTAGQEEYDRLRPLSYPETDLIFVCFAIDCPNSLENVMDKWYPEVLHFCPYTPLILVGLKSDLRYKKTCIDMLKTQGLTPVTTDQGLAVATKMGAQYMECSSKEMTGVEEIFERAILTVVANDRKTLEQEAAAGGGGDSSEKKGGRGRSGTTTGGATFSSGGAGGASANIPGVGLVPKRKKRNCRLV